MKTTLVLEKFNPRMELIGRWIQPSRSYVCDFFRVLYTQHSQLSTFMSPHANNGLFTSGPGYGGWLYGQSHEYGIVIGEGDTAVDPTDTHLEIPIGHGKRFKGTPPQFTNPGFETGDFTGWTTGGGVSVVAGGFNGSGGNYYCQMGSGAGTNNIRQDLDLTNVVALMFKSYLYGGVRARVYIDAAIEFEFTGSGSIGYNIHLYLPLSYAGVKTVKIEYYTSYGGTYWYVDKVYMVGKELEYGGSELLEPIFAGANGEFTLRRFFTNHSGSTVTVKEVGLVVGPGRQAARDLVTPNIDLADGEILRVTYTPQITV